MKPAEQAYFVTFFRQMKIGARQVKVAHWVRAQIITPLLDFMLAFMLAVQIVELTGSCSVPVNCSPLPPPSLGMSDFKIFTESQLSKRVVLK